MANVRKNPISFTILPSSKNKLQTKSKFAVRLLLRRRLENRPKAVGKVCSERQLKVHLIPLVDAWNHKARLGYPSIQDTDVTVLDEILSL
ncbi:hypothetical protein J6590_083273 [Homalodisca vitripennis]|nr:hypothetical protein J6590_083273 [Homalodisca vitripennis]